MSNKDIISQYYITRAPHILNFTSRNSIEVQKTMYLDIWELCVYMGKKPNFFSKLLKRRKNTLLNIIMTPTNNYDVKKGYLDSDKIYPLIYSNKIIKYPIKLNTNQKVDLNELDEFLPMNFIDDVNKNEITKLESEICLNKETNIIIPIGFAIPSGFYFITPTLKPYLSKDNIPHLDGIRPKSFYIMFYDGDNRKATITIEIDKYLDKFDVSKV